MRRADMIHAGERIRAELGGTRAGMGRWMVRCPSHDDHRPSLSIRVGERGLLTHCFAGCSRESIIDELRGRGLWPGGRGRRPRRPRVRGWRIPPGWAPGPGEPDPREDRAAWEAWMAQRIRERELQVLEQEGER